MTNHMNHPYHLVEKSPWPIIASIGAFLLTTGLLKWFTEHDSKLFLMALTTILITSAQWWRDVSREASFQGLHSIKVISSMQWGMILFIVSEILFFFSFFWAFFHNALNATMEIGNLWPPTSILVFNPFQIPLLNTAVLLTSGVTVTWSHHAVAENNHSQATQSLILTIILGLYFTALQALEYYDASFSIADSVYGSTFFIATGFHGLHVIIGSTFLMMCYIRMLSGHFSSNHHTGFESAIWYWHFVDVVWLFLYMSIYWWGS